MGVRPFDIRGFETPAAGEMGVRPFDIRGCAILGLGEIGFVLQNGAVCLP